MKRKTASPRPHIAMEVDASFKACFASGEMKEIPDGEINQRAKRVLNNVMSFARSISMEDLK